MPKDVLSTPQQAAARATLENALTSVGDERRATTISEAALERIKKLIAEGSPDSNRLLHVRIEAARTRLLSLRGLKEREAAFLARLGYTPPLTREQLAELAQKAGASANSNVENELASELAQTAGAEQRLYELADLLQSRSDDEAVAG